MTIETIVMAAALIVTPPGSSVYFPVPQENMTVCERTAKMWSTEWRRTEFICVPTTEAEQRFWIPNRIRPKNQFEELSPPKDDG